MVDIPGERTNAEWAGEDAGGARFMMPWTRDLVAPRSRARDLYQTLNATRRAPVMVHAPGRAPGEGESGAGVNWLG
jgi:hypothetical protein